MRSPLLRLVWNLCLTSFQRLVLCGLTIVACAMLSCNHHSHRVNPEPSLNSKNNQSGTTPSWSELDLPAISLTKKGKIQLLGRPFGRFHSSLVLRTCWASLWHQPGLISQQGLSKYPIKSAAQFGHRQAHRLEKITGNARSASSHCNRCNRCNPFSSATSNGRRLWRSANGALSNSRVWVFACLCTRL